MFSKKTLAFWYGGLQVVKLNNEADKIDRSDDEIIIIY